MLTASYPRIGSKVNYVRQGENGQMVEGNGTVLAVVLDPAKRLMVHLETDELVDGQKSRRNVHANCLFPSDDFKASFKGSLDAIRSMGDEGNGKAQEIVTEYNKRVDAAYDVILGVAVKFDE